MFRPFLTSIAGLCIALALAIGAAAAAADPLAERLIGLRSEIEALNDELELLREEQRTTLAGLAAQRAELSASVDRQQLAARDAQRKLDEATTLAAEAGASGDVLRPLIEQAIDGLAAWIRTGLPFKTDDRMAELESFRAQVANGSLPPARAVNRLWALFEDELRLTRDNSLHKQTIQLGDERVLADVAKLGSMQLYFRTHDGRVGQAVRGDSGWRFAQAGDEASATRIDALFDALQKQIRQGYFELPVIAGAAP